MATTVNNAFAEFLKDTVRLDPERNKIAKSSKGWLIDEIKKFPADGKFPALHPDVFIEYGSYSRKTKIRPLDDIDIMIIMHAQGATYNENLSHLTVTKSAQANQFDSLCFDNSSFLNSIKVVNKFKDYLGDVPQYKKAEIKRNQEAAVLELQSYEWKYDIVPCFITNPEWNGRTYYLIPDGNGNWKKTDPRIDHQNVLTIDSSKSVSVLDVIRLMKYWNGRPTMPSAKSYLLENIVLNYFKSIPQASYVDLEVRDCLIYIANAILNGVDDPKGIQGDLNHLTNEERMKIRERAYNDHVKAAAARTFEQNGDMKNAIGKWREIFGDAFPNYTS
jgi:hypothetical protein